MFYILPAALLTTLAAVWMTKYKHPNEHVDSYLRLNTVLMWFIAALAWIATVIFALQGRWFD